MEFNEIEMEWEWYGMVEWNGMEWNETDMNIRPIIRSLLRLLIKSYVEFHIKS